MTTHALGTGPDYFWRIKHAGGYLGPRWVGGIDCGVPQILERKRAIRFSTLLAAAQHLDWVQQRYSKYATYQDCRVVRVRMRPSTRPETLRGKVRTALQTLERGAYGHGICELRAALRVGEESK